MIFKTPAPKARVFFLYPKRIKRSLFVIASRLPTVDLQFATPMAQLLFPDATILNSASRLLATAASRISSLISCQPYTVFGLMIATWLISHPWLGIWHDGMLYLGQALHRIHPENYKSELFFRFGSQDDFTLFTPLYAALITAVGIPLAASSLMFVAHIAWFIAIFCVFSQLLQHRGNALIACAVLMLLPSFYGGGKVFSISEPFLTARSFAEVFVLFGIYCLLKRSVVGYLLLTFVACAIHPLMGATGYALAICYVIVKPQRPWHRYAVGVLILFGVACAAALARLGIGPFAALALQYDVVWHVAMTRFNPAVVVSQWNTSDWIDILSILVLFNLYFRSSAPSAQRSVVLAIVLASICSIVTSFIGADVLKNVFINSIQGWRVLWIYHAIVPSFCFVWVISERKNLNVMSRWAAELAVLALLLSTYYQSIISLVLAVILTFARKATVRPSVARLLEITLGAALLIGVLTYALEYSLATTLRFGITAWQILTPPATGVCLVVMMLAICASVPNRAINGVVLVAYCVFALATWDRRPPQEQLLEASAGNNPLVHAIKPDETVFWAEFAPLPWMVLDRTTYSSPMLASAVLFKRDYAKAYAQRLSGVQYNYIQSGCTAAEYANRQCKDNARNINPKFCADNSKMDWIVSGYRSEYPAAAHWQFSTSTYRDGLYLYSCKEWRRLASNADSTPTGASPQ